MRSRLRSVLVLTVTATVVAAIGTGLAPQATQAEAPTMTFDIDPVHSTTLFRVHHLKAAKFWGRFNAIAGTFEFAEGRSSTLAFDVTIPIESVDTNSKARDEHLRSPDFFNATEFPTMTFRSTGAKRLGRHRYEVTGDLTLRGVTKPISARVEWTGSNDAGGRFGYRCGLEARFTIKRSDYGVSYGVQGGLIGDETDIIVSIEGMRQ